MGGEVMINPLDIIARKQLVGREEAALIELPVLIHFDAAKRGRCTNAGANFLTTHLIIASFIAARTRSKRFHEQVTKAYAMLTKASERPTKALELTTTEYAAIKIAIASYMRALPSVEVGIMSDACKVAEKAMS